MNEAVSNGERREQSSLTDDDYAILEMLHERWIERYGERHVETQSQTQDDRDGTLMYEAQRIRGLFHRINPLIANYEDTDRINMGGQLWWDPEFPHGIEGAA